MPWLVPDGLAFLQGTLGVITLDLRTVLWSQASMTWKSHALQMNTVARPTQR